MSQLADNGEVQGTEYRITVNFKQAYSYKITITAARIMSTQSGPNVLLRTNLTNDGSGSNNRCNGMGTIDVNSSGDLKKSLQVTNSSFSTSDTNYVFDYHSLSEAQVYLMVAAIAPPQSVSQTVLIRRIKIEETPPAASFSISSSASSITCGATTPITFTINNNASTPGITGYTWNLGATPNGWLYNGNPAPESIPVTATSLSQLTLTPDCGKPLSSVSATVTANGSNYNTTNSASISITQPTMSINGSSSFCSGSSTYSITGLPCNATVAWSASPTGIVTPETSSATNPSFTKVGDGKVTLSATVTSCGVSQPMLTKTIQVGAYSASNYSLNAYGSTSGQPLFFCPNQTYNFYVTSNIPASNFNWSPLPAGWTLLSGSGSSSAYIKASSSTNTGIVNVSFTEPCGTSITLSKTVWYNSNLCNQTNLYTITPNPVISNITIASTSPSTDYYISQVEITDLYGQVKMRQSWAPYKYQQVTFNATYLYPPGIYIARIYTGTQWFYKQFVKQ